MLGIPLLFVDKVGLLTEMFRVVLCRINTPRTMYVHLGLTQLFTALIRH